MTAGHFFYSDERFALVLWHSSCFRATCMKTGKQTNYLVAGCIGLALLFPGTSSIGSEDVSAITVAIVSDTKTAVSGESRIQELEKKAAERDLYLAQLRELQKRLDMLTGHGNAVMGEVDAEGTGYGQLIKLREKAAMVGVLTRQVENLKSDNETLLLSRDALQEQVVSLQKELGSVAEREREQEQEAEELKKQNEGLKNTISLLLQGEFEYYEVKEGDTLQSIAADPMVYGDAARSRWLRQANRNLGLDLNRLQKGDILVVPFYPRTGVYEF